MSNERKKQALLFAADLIDLPIDGPLFCNFLIRDGSFCNVDVSKNPCGYHKSTIQCSREETIKESILEVLHDVFVDQYDKDSIAIYSNSMDSLLGSMEGKSAYDLLYRLFSTLLESDKN